MFPDGRVTNLPKVAYKYIGAQQERMREQLLKGGLRLAGALKFNL